MKAILKQQAKELVNYARNKHTQEECIGFIDGFKRACELMTEVSSSNEERTN